MTLEKYFFLLVTTGVLYLFWKVIQPFLLVIIVASVAAIILSPLDHALTRRFKRPRASAILLSSATFFFVFIPLLSVLFLMASQASDLIRSSINDLSWLGRIEQTVSPFLSQLPLPIQAEIRSVNIGEVGKTVANWSFHNIGGVFTSSTKLLLNTFVFFLCLYYILVNRDRLYDEALTLSPFDNAIDKALIKRIINTIRSVIFGVLLVALIQGIVATIGLVLFGVPGSLIWGALAAVAGLIPLLGTAIVLVPAILFLFFTGHTVAAVGLLIWSVIFVSTIDNLIGPYLIGGKAHMNSFLVLISVLGGLAAFGSVGAIAGPSILAALLGLIELYKSGILTTGKLTKKM